MHPSTRACEATLVLALEPVLSLRGPFDRYRQMLEEVVLRDRSAALDPELSATGRSRPRSRLSPAWPARR